MKSIIKWAGGKSQLLKQLDELKPYSQYERYFEPFFGGGALCFFLKPERAIIGDINQDLISMYRSVRDNVDEVIGELMMLQHRTRQYGKSFFNQCREYYNSPQSFEDSLSKRAALFIFLNKYCYNGLYRVNSKGNFNVPYGQQDYRPIDYENIRAVSEYLKNQEIRQGNFSDIVSDAAVGDFVFLDPPYVSLKSDSSVEYTSDGFIEADHDAVAELYEDLDWRGCFVMATNSDCPYVRELYSRFDITPINVRRSINRDGTKRTAKEIVITNYTRR